MLERFDHDVAALHAGAEPAEREVALLLGRVGDEVAVIPLEPAVVAFWERLAGEAVPEPEARETLGDDWVDALLEAGALALL